MMKSTIRLGLTCMGFGVLACEAEPETLPIGSSQAALTAAENADRALQGVVDAGDFLAGATSIVRTLNAIGGRGESCASSAPCTDVSACAPVECTTNEISEADLEEARQELREGFSDLVAQLRERVLIPANLESETETSATYRLGPDLLCDELPSDPSLPESGGYETECLEQVNRLQPRLRLTSPSEGDIDVAVLLGATQRQPFSFQLHHDSIGVRLDLGESFAIARAEGEDLGGLDDLSGVLELRLVQNRARDYSLELNVLSAIRVEASEGAGDLSMSLGATSPALELRVDGNARSLSAGMNLGALNVVGPLRLFSDMFDGDDTVVIAPDSSGSGDALVAPEQPEPPVEEPEYTGMLEIFLAGLSSTTTYVADSDVLDITNIGFGDSTSSIKHDGNTVFGLDLNALTGRRVNLKVAPGADGTTQVSVTPSFDLTLELAYRHIADQFENIEEYLLDNTIRVLFDGEDPAFEADDEVLRVTSGHLNLHSESPAVDIDVAANMCLVENAEAAASGPFKSLEANACE